ncbi:hypothetical protein [Paenibacillus foliorum]|uniref:hypothetical protein n=1 Tax=Paenibacillus foliorum TaxID=2654974 RepID=UPI0014923374|nr:hypothetical protein [Paenibacillus foliorum]
MKLPKGCIDAGFLSRQWLRIMSCTLYATIAVGKVLLSDELDMEPKSNDFVKH